MSEARQAGGTNLPLDSLNNVGGLCLQGCPQLAGTWPCSDGAGDGVPSLVKSGRELLPASSHTGAPQAVPDTDEIFPCCPLRAAGLWEPQVREVVEVGSTVRAGGQSPQQFPRRRNTSAKQTFGLCPEDNTGGKNIPPINVDLCSFQNCNPCFLSLRSL